MPANEIRLINSSRKIYDITDSRFKRYGRVVQGYDLSELARYLDEQTEVPAEGNTYVASVQEMEDTAVCPQLEDSLYGEAPIQIGYCNGNNSQLNALEYHKCTETIHAVTDLILLLGNVWDITDGSYSADRVEAFYVAKGSTVELYGTTLHFAPCKVYSSGFKAVIILSKGTNTELTERSNIEGDSENKLLFMNNKWLIAHPDATNQINNGAYVGITGENISLRSL